MPATRLIEIPDDEPGNLELILAALKVAANLGRDDLRARYAKLAAALRAIEQVDEPQSCGAALETLWFVAGRDAIAKSAVATVERELGRLRDAAKEVVARELEAMLKRD